MRHSGTRFSDFYQTELSALRDEALTFADRHPGAAQALGIGRQRATDPQAELLMQSFAYLAGRLQYQRALDQALLPNALLAFLYPHLEAPLPSMLVAEIGVRPDGANFSKEQVLARGRYVTARASNEHGRQIECRFRTCYDTPLLPLRIEDIRLESSADYTLPASSAQTRSLLRVRIVAEGGKLQLQDRQRLRFHINGAEPNGYAAYKLYEMLALRLTGIAVEVQARPGRAGGLAVTPPQALHWLGFADDEAMLETGVRTHPGYRLLQEYFGFREKFMFFEARDLDLSGAQDGFDLLFLLDTPADKQLTFTPQALRLNCVPLVNLFSQRIEPLALDQTQYEYRLSADLENHRHCEIYALQSLESTRPDGEPREIVPYFGMDNMQELENRDYFYVTRRACSSAPNVAGTEIYVSFLDTHFDLTLPADEVVGGKAWCTNRRLPEQIRTGQLLHLEGPGPVARIAALTRAMPHHTPDLIGNRPWELVSQLALNHLSLADGPQALAALKEVLRLHVGPDRIAGLREIDGLRELHCRAMTRHVGRDGWRGFVRGIHVHLDMDRNKFEDGSPVLFCEVLRRFFTLYATINNLVEVSLETQDIKGGRKQWQAQPGAQTVL